MKTIQFNQKLYDNINYWITSDLHFGHHNIMKFCPATRPWTSATAMDEALIAEWNSKVQPNDVVFHLGDFSFYGIDKTKEILSRLNGTIVFVLGNHDKSLDSTNLPNKFRLLEVRFKGHKLVMCHYPMVSWNQNGRGSIMFHGHCHGSLPKQPGRILDVGYDSLGSIMRLDVVVNKMLKQPIQTQDKH